MTDSFSYAESISKLISETPSRGSLTVRHNRKKYELSLAAAKTLAYVAWSTAARTSYTLPRKGDTYPRIHVGFTTKSARQQVFEQRLVERGTSKQARRDDSAWLNRGGRMWGKRLTEVGTIVAALCFNEITGLDMRLAAVEVQRLRDVNEERERVRRERVADGLRGLHLADGNLVLTLQHSLTRADEVAIADQIKALREQAATALERTD